MPSRIVREGIISSSRIAALVRDAGWFGEAFYRRLLNKADDFGRFTADPALLRLELFPREVDKVRETDMQRLLAACEKARLIALYVVKDEPYLIVLDFRQKTRAVKSKWPDPPDCVADAAQMIGTCRADAGHVSTEAQSEAQSKAEAQGPPPKPGREIPEDPLLPAKNAAMTAFDQWSGRAPPVGRSLPLNPVQNEHAAVFTLVETMAQEPPIPRGNQLIGRHLLIAQAADVLAKKGVEFKRVKFAVGCVKHELEDWANGLDGARKNKPKTTGIAVREDV